MSKIILSLSVMPERLAICRLNVDAEIPGWTAGSPFLSITRTTDELSIICLEEKVPQSVQSSREWRALKLEGPFDFELVGILESILKPLAEEGIAVLSVATYETDYVLIKAGQYERAIAVLVAAGHRIKRV